MRGKKIYYLATVAFLAYTAWMIGPYLRSVIVRDASVTSWSRSAVSPIDGKLVGALPTVDTYVDEDGRVAVVRNDLLLEEGRSVEDTNDRMIRAESRIKEAQDYLDDLAELDRQRIAARDEQAKVFHAQLETEIANLRASLSVNGEQIEVLTRITERLQGLSSRGRASKSDLDEALLRLAETKAARAALEARLKFAQLRDRSAEKGIFITADGGTPDWLRYGELDLTLEARRARHEQHAAESDLAEAKKDLNIGRQTLAALAEADVQVPPGSVIFSLLVTPAATVAAGDRIVEWIDCTELLVDVPVSDAELPLIKAGSPAEAVLEGESMVRQATVLLTRGSSATLGRADLAAIAKGRGEGDAQVLLTLDVDPAEFASCPVGRAAYVEFPEVGLVDVLRARLRL